MTNDFDIVIFGGTGDLSTRKLLPALYRCQVEGRLPECCRIFITSRNPKDGNNFTGFVEKTLNAHLDKGEFSKEQWKVFSKRLQFVELDITTGDERWQPLAGALAEEPQRVRVFYMATPPNLYGPACQNMSDMGMITSHSRIVLEKPIGYSLETAREINSCVAKHFPEESIFRIDHYLGKETVQNLLALRFTNVLFEHLWDNKSIEHVQITLAETVGLEGRVAFYDKAGAVRDMVQNHMLQLLCLVAMEPPLKMNAQSIRSEKLKVMQALRPIEGERVAKDAVRGQYVSGNVSGKDVNGYLDELTAAGGDANSTTETYVAIRAHIDNWRWAGVPFYLRTGKSMKERFAEIVVQFKPVSHRIYPESAGDMTANRLVIRLQPEESMRMCLMAKALNQTDVRLKPVNLNLNFQDTYQGSASDGYKRMLLDVAEGNPTLFAHRDEVEQAWTWLDPILNSWKASGRKPERYPAGSWGPEGAAFLIHRDNRRWLSESIGMEE
ncbi:MAG: glucose-6-phosphate dehydrogenase [Cellvibrionaceae bacterium]